MQDESLGHKTLKNVSYSFIGYVWPIAFSVFITPVIVRKLGVSEYGIYVLINTIMAFLALLDLGLSIALTKYISEYYATQENARLRQLIRSANSLFLMVGLLGFTVFFLVGRFLLPFFKINVGGQQHILLVFILAGLVFFLNAITSVYSIIPPSLQRYDVSTKLSLVQLTLFNFSILTAVLLGYRLEVIFALNLAVIALWSLGIYYFSTKLLPEARVGFGWVSEEVKRAYKFGILAAIVNLSNSSLMQLDRLLIPAFVGPAQLTYYSLPGSVAQKTSGITGSLGSIFFPLTSALKSKGETERINMIYRRGFRGITVIAAAVSFAIAFFSYKILYFWLGSDFAEKGTVILLILAATYFVLSVYAPLTNFLLGFGKVKFLTKASVFLALLNMLLLVLLLPPYGIKGAAWAFLGGVVPIPVYFYWTEKHLLGLTDIGSFYMTLYAKLLLTGVVFYFVCKLLLLKLVISLPTLIVVGPVSVLVYFMLYFLFGFVEKEDKEMLKTYFARLAVRVGLGRFILFNDQRKEN